jgi:hypothetical protein
MSGFIGDIMPSILGGGRPGGQPRGGLLGGGAGQDGGSGMNGGNIRAMDRKLLRQAFGNSARALTNLPNHYSSLGYATNIGSQSGMFRAAMNAGDVLGTVNEAANSRYGPISNQVNGITRHTALGGFRSIADGVRKDGNAAYVGNPKYVYDSSDYIRFKKLAAKNKTYNDSSFGGSTNSSQSTIRKNL